MRRVGGCQCGKVRYQCDDEARDIYVCHCTNCQKQSSSAFGISFVVPATSFRVTEGAPQCFEWETDSGNRRRGAFCSSCGTRLWHQAARENVEQVRIKAGSFDNPVDLSNAIHIWLSSKLPGVIVPGDTRQFPEEPE